MRARAHLVLAMLVLATAPTVFGSHAAPATDGNPYVDERGDVMTGPLDLGGHALWLGHRALTAESGGPLTFDGVALCTAGDEACRGVDGAAGADGQDGVDGLHCWDLDGDGAADAGEDVNGDDVVDALDCRGADGTDGADGADGAPGADGQDGVDGVDGRHCWDLDGVGVGAAAEDRDGNGVFDARDCRGSVAAFDCGAGQFLRAMSSASVPTCAADQTGVGTTGATVLFSSGGPLTEVDSEYPDEQMVRTWNITTTGTFLWEIDLMVYLQDRTAAGVNHRAAGYCGLRVPPSLDMVARTSFLLDNLDGTVVFQGTQHLTGVSTLTSPGLVHLMCQVQSADADVQVQTLKFVGTKIGTLTMVSAS